MVPLGNARESRRLYFALLDMWDGHGINDKVTGADGQYAVYKIAPAHLRLSSWRVSVIMTGVNNARAGGFRSAVI